MGELSDAVGEAWRGARVSSPSPPGFPTTSAGHRHSSETPTSESTNPNSATISVALGRNEQTRIVPDSSPGAR